MSHIVCVSVDLSVCLLQLFVWFSGLMCHIVCLSLSSSVCLSQHSVWGPDCVTLSVCWSVYQFCFSLSEHFVWGLHVSHCWFVCLSFCQLVNLSVTTLYLLVCHIVCLSQHFVMEDSCICPCFDKNHMNNLCVCLSDIRSSVSPMEEQKQTGNLFASPIWTPEVNRWS